MSNLNNLLFADNLLQRSYSTIRFLKLAPLLSIEGVSTISEYTISGFDRINVKPNLKSISNKNIQITIKALKSPGPHLSNFLTRQRKRVFLIGVIHKPCGQFFGHFWPNYPLVDHFIR